MSSGHGHSEPAADPAEQRLVADLKAGDDRAFERLVRDYGGHMLAVTRRLLHNDEDAQDAVQDALLSAFRAIGNFQSNARLRTWLHRIALNSALARLRKSRRRNELAIEGLLPRFLEDGHQAQPPVSWAGPADELLQSEETRRKVRECIQQLPDAYRIVLQLRDIEELDTNETAELLGIDAGLTKVRLHRARQALRTLLEDCFKGHS